MAHSSRKLYMVTASGVYFVVAENEEQARELYRESTHKVEGVDIVREIACEDAQERLTESVGKIEDYVIEAPTGTPEELIIRALHRMSESEKGEAWSMIRRFEETLKLKVKHTS